MAAEDLGAGALGAVCGVLAFAGVEARAVCNVAGVAWAFVGVGLREAGWRSGVGMGMSMSG